MQCNQQSLIWVKSTYILNLSCKSLEWASATQEEQACHVSDNQAAVAPACQMQRPSLLLTSLHLVFWQSRLGPLQGCLDSLIVRQGGRHVATAALCLQTIWKPVN